ncbi:MAG TPA: metalloregulator ArsR/SmtB family transcription factor [Actinomycetota bacterium]|jgi:DNA-binding transcriptional ArsR family regulator
MPADLDRTLAALAEPTRRGVVELLRRKPRRASEIAAALQTTRPAMSRHLRILRRAGLIAEQGLEHDARARVYSLRPEPLTDLRGWLEEVEAFWGEQLRAFKARAERSPRRSRG